MVISSPRRRNRLPDYDYSTPGWYYVTICAYRLQCWFGDVVDGEMELNSFGKIAEDCWNKIPKHFKNVELDEYIIMPNHIHGIIIINCSAVENITVGNADLRSLRKICHICWRVDNLVY